MIDGLDETVAEILEFCIQRTKRTGQPHVCVVAFVGIKESNLCNAIGFEMKHVLIAILPDIKKLNVGFLELSADEGYEFLGERPAGGREGDAIRRIRRIDYRATDR